MKVLGMMLMALLLISCAFEGTTRHGETASNPPRPEDTPTLNDSTLLEINHRIKTLMVEAEKAGLTLHVIYRDEGYLFEVEARGWRPQRGFGESDKNTPNTPDDEKLYVATFDNPDVVEQRIEQVKREEGREGIDLSTSEVWYGCRMLQPRSRWGEPRLPRQ